MDAEAEALEHAISPRLEQAIADYLGEPHEDPHGHPIPSRTGEMKARNLRQLSTFRAGQTVIVREAQDDSPDRLRHWRDPGADARCPCPHPHLSATRRPVRGRGGREPGPPRQRGAGRAAWRSGGPDRCRKLAALISGSTAFAGHVNSAGKAVSPARTAVLNFQTARLTHSPRDLRFGVGALQLPAPLTHPYGPRARDSRPERELPVFQLLACNVACLTIAALYYAWRDVYLHRRKRRSSTTAWRTCCGSPRTAPPDHAAVPLPRPGPHQGPGRFVSTTPRRLTAPAVAGTITSAKSRPVPTNVPAVPMFTKRIIPCLDVDRGRVVKGTNFVGLRDAGDPVEVARRYDEQGADELVFLDISASHEGRAIMLEMVRRVAEEIFMPFTVGGGIRTLDDATRLIQAGAEKVSLNSAAVKTPDLIAEVSRKFGTLRHGGEHRPAPRAARRPRVLGGARQRRARADRAGSGRVGAGAWTNSAPARSCSRRWTPTAPRTATTCRCWKR